MAIDESQRTAVVVTPDSASPPEPSSGDDVPVVDLFRRVYQFFYSKTVGVLLILATAVMVLLGVLIGQAPGGTYGDEVAEAQFLDEASHKYGGWAKVFHYLGLFHVFSSPLFLIVIILLGLSIIACTTHRIPQLWQKSRHPRTHVSDRFYDRARYRASVETDLSSEQALGAMKDYLRSKRYRILDDEKDPGRGLYVDRFSWGPFGTVIAHASFIIIMVAFLVTASGGIDDQISVPVGGSGVEVGHDTGLSVEAPTFKDAYDENGRPTDYVSHLIVRKGDAVVGEQDVRVNTPLRYGGVKFHQASFGIAADVLVKDGSGKTVYQAPVPLKYQSSDGQNSIGYFDLEDLGLEIQVATAASGADSSQLAAGEATFALLEKDAQEPMTMVKAQQGQEAELGDFKVTFERERQYTGIMVREDPGAVWMWIGSALLVIGMMITFACRHRRLWIRVDDADGASRRIRFASADKEDFGFERQFKDLVLGVPAALGAVSPAKNGGQS